MQGLCQKHRLTSKTLSAAGRRRLRAYPWPSNVRELSHELERAIVFEDTTELNFPQLGAPGPAESPGDVAAWFNPNFQFPETGFALDDAIRHLIDHALKQTDNNVSAAARRLGVTRDYLRYRLSGQAGKMTNDE